MNRSLALCALLTLSCAVPLAARPKAPQFPDVRPIPPPGVSVLAEDRATLESGIKELGEIIEAIRTTQTIKPALRELLPDIQIYHNAVRYALTYNEFFNANEVRFAKTLLAQGKSRAQALQAGTPFWTTQTGPIVRGYLSKIDGSVQPYGLVVPETYSPNTPHKFRLDLWFHGRGENLSEVNFLRDRQANLGEFAPPNTFVLHPYGRYCNANKFAGEIDTLEAIEHARKSYPLDENRTIPRGFSMGGAACWQFAVHYAGDWAAAAPGAGFSESADFLKVAQTEKAIPPTWYEQKLWRMYDATEYALNLLHCPVVAYSGEKDGQKQAADRMSKAMEKEGIALSHVIGANAGHFYTAPAKVEINRRIDSIAAIGRNPIPNRVRFTTFTLRYNRMLWVTLDGLAQHWERAKVDAEILSPSRVRVKTNNITALTLSMPPGLCPLDATAPPTVTLDGKTLTAPRVLSDRSWTAKFRKGTQGWEVLETPEENPLRKRPGLQGPIDDAFMDSFLMVTPTGTPLNSQVGAWVKAEQAHAITHWRIQFRGEARVKQDTEVTPEDIAQHNLVLWGDPASNRILAQIAEKLPIRWSASEVRLGEKTFSADAHVPVFLFPNPLNPKKYVVINSGFTFREYDYLNNARQISKLPDFAVIDTRTPVSARFPGKVVEADFFTEAWDLPKTTRK
jgi:pimeloyl-ACP methyl ester carboxylesterase